MSTKGQLADTQPKPPKTATTIDDAQISSANDPSIIRIEGIENVRVPVAPHLETVIRCKRASIVVQGGDGSTDVTTRNAVMRIEGDPEPG